MAREKRPRQKTWRQSYKRNVWKKIKSDASKKPKVDNLDNNKQVLNVSLITGFLQALEDRTWHEALDQISDLAKNSKTGVKIDADKLLAKGTELLRYFNKSYSVHISKADTDEKWLYKSATGNTVRYLGGSNVTKSDRLNSLALLLEQNAILNFFSLKKILDIAQSNVNRDRIAAFNALHVIFLEKLLPDRKLLFISDYSSLTQSIELSQVDISNLKESTLSVQLLLLLTFEHHLKLAYSSYVEILARGLSDHLFIVQKTSLDIITDLLTKKPEQEYALLQLLVRQIPNPNSKISSRSSWNLRQVLKVHSGFKKYIVDLIGGILYKTTEQMNTGLKASTRWKHKKHKKKAKGLPQKVQDAITAMIKILNFLFEIQKNDKNETLESLVKVYIQFIILFFKENNDKLYVKDEASRAIRAMSIGLDKCLETISNQEIKMKGLKEEIETRLNVLYRITHTIKSSVTLVTLLGLVYQLTSTLDLPKTRFYRLFYSKLCLINLFNTSNEKRFYNIVYKVLLQSGSLSIVSAFIKRIVQAVVHHSNSSVTLAYLIIISNILYNNKKLKSMFKKDEDVFDYNKRDPEYSNAENSYFWEKHLFASSYDIALSTLPLQVNKFKFTNFQKLSDKIGDHNTFKKLEILVNSNQTIKYTKPYHEVYAKYFKLQPKRKKAKSEDKEEESEESEDEFDLDEIFADGVDPEERRSTLKNKEEQDLDEDLGMDSIVNFDQFKEEYIDTVPLSKQLERVIKNRSFVNAEVLAKYLDEEL